MHQIVEAGTQVLEYKVDKLLGCGATASVYLGYAADGTKVAIKHQKFYSEKEIEIYRAIKDHEFRNINNIYDFKEDDEKLWVIMEYLSGPDITTAIKTIRPEEIDDMLYQVQIIGYKICFGIYELHLQKLIHRDIKPDNMMVHISCDKKIYKIVDLGLACVVKQKEQEQSQKMTKTGTPIYMAPELWDENGTNNDKGYTNAVDIWALGIIIYELFNKKNLITGYTERIVREQIRNLKITEELLKNIPDKYQDIVKGCLQQKAEDRLQIDQILIILDKDRFEKDGQVQKIQNFSALEQQQNLDKKLFDTDQKAIQVKVLAKLRAFFKPNNKIKNDSISNMCYEMARVAAVVSEKDKRNVQMREYLNVELERIFVQVYGQVNKE